MRHFEKLRVTALAGLLAVFGAWSVVEAQDAPAPSTGKPLVTEGSGPYKVVIEGDPSLPTHTIYRPEDLQAVKGKMPILSWANGGCANSSNGSRTLLSEIASHGFLVLAIGPADSVLNAPPPGAGRGEGRGPGGPGGARGPGAGGPRPPATKSSQLLDAIAWATAENSRDGSPYKGKIAANKVAIMGHSCGGLEVLDVSTDPRISTTIVLSGGIPDWSNPQGVTPTAPRVQKDILGKQHAPLLYVFGGPKDIAYNYCLDDWTHVQGVPAFAASYTSALHAGTYNDPNGGEMAKVIVAWMEWQLQGKKDEKKMFVGDSCELCKNADWKVQQKDLK